MGKHNNKGSVYAQNKKVASSSKQKLVLPKRLTFTALEKLRIIDEVERSNDAQAVLQKYLQKVVHQNEPSELSTAT